MRRAIYEDDVIKLLDKGWKLGVYPVASNIHALPSAQPDRSLWFHIGETCVAESKGFISAERAVEKIRELLREGW